MNRERLMAHVSEAVFVKSAFSGHEECVEVAELPDETMAVRNSKFPAAGVVCAKAREWNAFAAAV